MMTPEEVRRVEREASIPGHIFVPREDVLRLLADRAELEKDLRKVIKAFRFLEDYRSRVIQDYSAFVPHLDAVAAIEAKLEGKDAES